MEARINQEIGPKNGRGAHRHAAANCLISAHRASSLTTRWAPAPNVDEKWHNGTSPTAGKRLTSLQSTASRYTVPGARAMRLARAVLVDS
jgi:hypothetical protein